MGEFEPFGEGVSSERRMADGRQLPMDFTIEEAETAYWLNNLFDIAEENLPPRFAQTLLGDPLQAPADDDFEERITTAVFQRLEMERPTPPTKTPLTLGGRLRASTERLRQRVTRQGTLALMALLMLCSYNALGTGVALASVLQLVAGHGGAQAVNAYPQTITMTGTTKTDTTASRTLDFTPRWSGVETQGYTYTGLDVLDGQWWTKGALVMLHYERNDAAGAHHLTVLEFLPQVRLALQVVQAGSMQSVQIGDTSGVFVWGHWVRQSHQQMVWEPSQRAELVYGGTDDSGPVTWIAADDLSDQTAEQMQATLTTIATSLTPMSFDHTIMASDGMANISAQLINDLNQPFSNDIIALIPDHSDAKHPVVYVRIGRYAPNDS